MAKKKKVIEDERTEGERKRNGFFVRVNEHWRELAQTVKKDTDKPIAKQFEAALRDYYTKMGYPLPKE